MKIAVLGAGNGGFAAAVDLTLQGHEVNLYEGYMPKILGDLETINFTGVLGKGKIKPAKITTDAADAITDVDLLLNMTPALGHAHYAKLIAPYLTGKETIILTPGNTYGLIN
ncbi:MAG: 2-dehydropantoate 2-reductase N-terminal domain-containing protein [Candidatus Ranarchaeia archaeon]